MISAIDAIVDPSPNVGGNGTRNINDVLFLYFLFLINYFFLLLPRAETGNGVCSSDNVRKVRPRAFTRLEFPRALSRRRSSARVFPHHPRHYVTRWRIKYYLYHGRGRDFSRSWVFRSRVWERLILLFSLITRTVFVKREKRRFYLYT